MTKREEAADLLYKYHDGMIWSESVLIINMIIDAAKEELRAELKAVFAAEIQALLNPRFVDCRSTFDPEGLGP